MFPSNLINHIAVLQKNTKKCQKIIKFLSMSKNAKKFRKYKAVCDRLLGKDVLVVICAGEDGAPRKCRCVLILCV